MPKTKAWYLISELNGYTLNIDDDGNLEMCSRDKHVWTKCDWLREIVRKSDSEYGDEFIEGRKQGCGHFKHVGTGNTIISQLVLRYKQVAYFH